MTTLAEGTSGARRALIARARIAVAATDAVAPIRAQHELGARRTLSVCVLAACFQLVLLSSTRIARHACSHRDAPAFAPEKVHIALGTRLAGTRLEIVAAMVETSEPAVLTFHTTSTFDPLASLTE